MWLRTTNLLLIAGLLSTCRSWAQNVPQSPPSVVSICDLLEEPGKFDKLKITIRGEVVSEFEDFSIRNQACGNSDLPGIWLMFGGDVGCPTPSTWDDVGRPKGKDLEFQGASYTLLKDQKFKEFYRFVTTRKHLRAVYRVNATLEGTFFAGHISTGKDPDKGLPGYGHLGCCRLFIIDRVVDVGAARIQ